MCTGDNHLVGAIAIESVRYTDWEREILAFEKKIDDFNIRGQRDQIPHPGFAEIFRYCPECGASLESFAIRKPQWGS